MRILFIHTGAELYGADNILYELIEGLIRLNHHIVVVIPSSGPLVDKLHLLGVEIIIKDIGVLRRKYFNFLGLVNRFSKLSFASIWLAWFILKNKIDIVHSNTSAVLAGAIASRIVNRPHVWHIHEITTKPVVIWKILSWIIPRLSDSVVGVSDAVLNHLISGNFLNRNKGTVIYNGITPFSASPSARKRVRDSFRFLDEHIVTGMVGRVNSWKGQRQLIDAASELFKKNNKLRFLLVGGVFPGEEYLFEELRARIRLLNLSEIILLVDFRKDVSDILSALDIFVLPSIEPDPFPTVVLEAMYSELPIVAFAHGGVLEMIEPNETGFIANKIGHEALAYEINKLINSEELRLSFGKKAKNRVEILFSKEKFIVNFIKLYEKLLLKENN